jgi:tripartite-type tricarboxylate transporter receptor subunit TctC
MFFIKRSVVGTVSALGFLLTTAAAAQAFSLEGKRVEIVVPFAEGGGTDVYARFIAPRLAKVLPGGPTVIIRNIPGGGSIAGANQFNDKAKPDGLTLLAVSTSTLFNYLLEDPRVKYDPAKWLPVLVGPLGNVSYIHTKTGIKTPKATPETLKALQGQELILGANGPTSSDLVEFVGFDLLGIKIKPVFGMNRGKSRQGLERGELTLSFDNTAAYFQQVAPLVKDGVAVPILARGYADENGNIGRDPSIPDLPTLEEGYKMLYGKAPSGPQYEAYKVLTLTSVMVSKAIVLPAGTPADIAEAYQKAARDLVKSPSYEKDAEQFSGGYPTLVDKPARANYLAATTMAPAVKDWLFGWVEKRFDVKRGTQAK